MKLCIFIILACISLALAGPVNSEEEQELPDQQILQPEEVPNADAPISLTDVQHLGNEHAEQGARNARWLWGRSYYYSPWSYYSYPQPWIYRRRSYW